MLTLLISILVGIGAGTSASTLLDSRGWCIAIGIVAFLVCSVLLNRHWGKKLTTTVEQVQAILQQSQDEAYKMINRFQSRPSGSPKAMESQVEKVVEKGVYQALELLDNLRPIYKWSLLAERQINTLKMQLFYQIKQFDQVDQLMPKIFVMEPLTLAMKITRQYHHDSPDLERTFRKGVKKFKYEKGLLLYALYSWILVKRKEIDRAVEILAEAKDKIDDETIHRNWQHVANNRIHLFSNATIGNQWYALHLEKPQKPKASKGTMKGNPLMPKGKRRFF